MSNFDIRAYRRSNTTVTDNNNNERRVFWSEAFLRYIDDNFPNINRECGELNERMTSKSEGAFKDKLEMWSDFTEVLQKLCRIYKIYDAKCLSKEN